MKNMENIENEVKETIIELYDNYLDYLEYGRLYRDDTDEVYDTARESLPLFIRFLKKWSHQSWGELLDEKDGVIKESSGTNNPNLKNYY